MRWLLPLALLGCELDKTGPGLGTAKSKQCTNSQGVVELEVEIDDEAAAMLITAQADSLVSFDQITSPTGEVALSWKDWYTADNYLTSAIWPVSDDSVLNWPVRPGDLALSAGIWEVRIASISSAGLYQAGVCVDLTVQTKSDEDFEDGWVYIRLVYAEGVEEQEGVADAVNQAIVRWEEVWAPYGLFPVVTTNSSNLDPNLPYVATGDPVIEALARGSLNDEVTLIVGETIDSATTYFGVAGAIPGSLVATPRSAVVLSWLANAGTDGAFSDADIRIMGETMAHEIGHYMGLFHPVEQTWENWDAASDTSHCENQEDCEEALGDNLMFPYPICTFAGCDPQGELSEIQTGILQRYTGTL